jgi:hypothetical protein
MKPSDIGSVVINQFFVGGLIFHFAGIFQVSCSARKFFKNLMLLQQLRNFFQYLEANMTPKIILQISTSPKGTSLRKSASIEAL